GDQKAVARHDERLGDGGPDGAHAARRLLADQAEGVEDAEHRSEQADEGSRRARRREHVEAPREALAEVLSLSLEGALGELGRLLAGLPVAAAREEGLDARADEAREVALLVFLRDRDGALVVARLERRAGLGREAARARSRREDEDDAIDDHVDARERLQ